MYAKLFDCKASKAEIEAEIPRIREISETPNELELSLMEIRDFRNRQGIPSDLLRFVEENNIYPTFPSKYRDRMKTAQPIRMKDLQYVIQTNYPNATNEDTAGFLGDFMNGVWATFVGKKPFNFAVITEIGEEYLFLN